MEQIINHIPLLGHVKVLIHQAAGDEELRQQAHRDVTNATSYMPLLGQLQAAYVAQTTTEEERLEDPAYGKNFVERSFTRGSAATIGAATTVMAGPLLIGAAGAAATSLGIAGVTGGVASGMIGAAAAGVAGGVAGTAAQHAGASMAGDTDELPTEKEFVVSALAGGFAGAIAGTVISRSAGVAAKGGAMTAVNIQIADALGLEGMQRAALKQTLAGAAKTAARGAVTAAAHVKAKIAVSIYKPGQEWFQMTVTEDETVASIVERIKAHHHADAKSLFLGGKRLEDSLTMSECGIEEGTDLTLA